MLINDLSGRICAYQDQLKIASSKVIDSGWLVLGPQVKQFEEAFAHYLGAAYCVSLANGTDAIELAFRSFGIVQGDLVATVANAGAYTTTALLAIGAEPFYVDVDLESRNITLPVIEQAIDAGVRAVVVTHLYGLAVPEIQEIAALCKSRNVPLLEDCAQAHGAKVGNQRVGIFGNAASFSFYPTKNLGALGDGGAVVTSDPEIQARVHSLRQYGWSSKYRIEMPGARNSRLDEIQAAFLSIFLPDLDAANARRRAIATQYSHLICHPKVKVLAIHGEEFVAHLYVVRVEGRDALRKHLKSYDIATDVHYPIPDYRQPVFGDRYDTLRLPNTETLTKEIMSLPCYPEMTDADVSRVVDAVNSWNAEN